MDGNTRIKKILRSKEACAVIDAYFPGFSTNKVMLLITMQPIKTILDSFPPEYQEQIYAQLAPIEAK